MKDRSVRRHHDKRVKANTRKKLLHWSFRPEDSAFYDDPKFVGKQAAVHCKGCSCFGCQHHKDVPPKRERGFELN